MNEDTNLVIHIVLMPCFKDKGSDANNDSRPKSSDENNSINYFVLRQFHFVLQECNERCKES